MIISSLYDRVVDDDQTPAKLAWLLHWAQDHVEQLSDDERKWLLDGLLRACSPSAEVDIDNLKPDEAAELWSVALDIAKNHSLMQAEPPA